MASSNTRGTLKDFAKLAPAVDHAEKHGLKVFSKDIGPHTACKSFLAGSVADFEDFYAASSPNDRNWYEVLREGRPVHLYFDLEFKRKDEVVDDDEIYAEFKKRAFAKCKELFDYEPSECVELVASNERKFSMHAVYKLSGARMRGVLDCGAFARSLDPLTVGDEPIVDLSVYTKNRLFRLWLSSKSMESAPRPLLCYGDYDPPLLRDTFVEVDEKEWPTVRCLECHDDESVKRKRGGGGGGTRAPKRRKNVFPSDFVIAIKRQIKEKWGCETEVLDVSLDRITFSSRSKLCDTYGVHRGNHAWFMASVTDGVIKQMCFSPKCEGKVRPSIAFDAAAVDTLKKDRELEEEVDSDFHSYASLL